MNITYPFLQYEHITPVADEHQFKMCATIITNFYNMNIIKDRWLSIATAVSGVVKTGYGFCVWSMIYFFLGLFNISETCNTC